MRTDIPLVSSVLHPTDFSAASDRAFAHALAIALLRKTELTILNVSDRRGDEVDWASFPAVRKTLERWNLLEPGSERAAVFEKLSIDVRKIALRDRDPVRATSNFLDQHPHDLVVLATSGSDEGASDWLFRSDAEAIARRAYSMTLFVPANAPRGLVSLEDGDLSLRNVLVPVDAAIDFTGAIEFACRSAEVIGDGDVMITLLHAGKQMPPIANLREGPDWSWRTELRNGEPVESILAGMEQIGADLIVMTTNGRDTLHQALAGSTTERVLRQASCPVLAVPAGRYGARA